MPWTEMSQSDFLVHVVKWQVLMDQIIMPNAVKIMEVVVNNPDRLHQSAFSAQKTSEKTEISSKTSRVSALFNSPNTTKRG